MKTVNILCVADEIDLLVYSSNIKERFGDVDLVLAAGDLPDEYLGFITAMLNKPLLSVAGNHDPNDRVEKQTFSPIRSIMFTPGRDRTSLGRISFRIKQESGVSVLGIPGSMLYNGGPNQYSEFAMWMHAISLMPGLLFRRLIMGRGVDIILAHAPPKGIHDAEDRCHRGFSAFNWLIRLARPHYFLHGHIHVYDTQQLREQKVGDTTVVNVYGHRRISINLEKKP
ncbi:MAG: metallophosphoesterase [Spirochaetia bacterium]|nr:metallophosphoesterase [Spirochaetia bacterium]